MRKLNLVFLLIFIFGFFFLITQSIIQIKIKELKFYIVREQLLNYELSSNLLKEKLKQLMLTKDDYSNEIKMSIMESSIMNSEIEKSMIVLEPMDRFGLVVVNVVRILTFKSPMKLEEDKSEMMMLQYAFYMERTRKYSIASKKYAELEIKFKGKDTDEYAFILLHEGFCFALMGDTESALKKLYETEKLFIGSQFALNARILINLLLEGQNKQENIKKKFTNVEDIILALYDSGQYRELLKILNKRSSLTPNHRYMRARSNEELGNSPDAIKEYLELVEQKEDLDVAKKANRRLLLISNLYDSNKQLSDFSKKKAEKLGDKEIVEKVEQGANLVLKPMVVEKILNSPEVSNDPEFNKIKETLKEEIQQIQEKITQENVATVQKITEIVEVEKKEEIKEVEYIPPLKLVLIDGRELYGNKIEFTKEHLLIYSGDFFIKLPESMFSELLANPKDTTKSGNMDIELENGTKLSVKKIQKVKGLDYIEVQTKDGTLRPDKRIESVKR